MKSAPSVMPNASTKATTRPNTLSPPVRAILSQGVAVATIDYRLSGEDVFPSQIHDVKAGVRHLRANAATYGIDARRMGTWGTSAGAHLATLLGTSGPAARFERRPP